MDMECISCDVRAREDSYRIGLLVLLWRRTLGITQYGLAARSGLTQSYISALESGQVDPRISTMMKVLRGFGRITASEFFEGPIRMQRLRAVQVDEPMELH